MNENRGKNWTIEEEMFLEEKFGILSYEKIAEKLGRPVGGISKKAIKLGLGNPLDCSGFLTANKLAEILGMDAKCIARWVKEYGLVGSKRNISHKRRNWQISINNFFIWAEKNQDKFNAFRIEENILGKEPEWLKVKRKNDYNLRNEGKPYTEEEDKFILSNYKYITYPEIALILGRSTNGITQRIKKIKNKGKDKVILLPWTDLEIEMLFEFKKQGLTLNNIAEELGRTLGSVRWKLRDLNYKSRGEDNK